MAVEANITVVGAYGVGNLGDDALLVSVLRAVREVVPDDGICVTTLGPAPYLSQWYPNIRFVPLLGSGPIKTKILIYGGGTQFCSFSDTTSTKTGRVLRLCHYMAHPLRLWKRLHKATFDFEHAAAISIGIGPFVPDALSEKLAREKLKSCEWISVRDAVSMKYCADLDVKDIEQNADLCFAGTLWDSSAIQEPRSGQMCRAGIIVRDWPHTRQGRSYFKKVRIAVRKLREEGIEVQYISFAKKRDTKTHSELCNEGENVLQWDPAKDTIRAFTEKLSGFDLMISARAHGVIMAAALGLPSIAIEVEPKLRLISSSLANGTELWSPPFDPDELVCKVIDMKNNWQKRCLSIFSEASACASEALDSTKTLTAYIKERVIL